MSRLGGRGSSRGGLGSRVVRLLGSMLLVGIIVL